MSSQFANLKRYFAVAGCLVCMNPFAAEAPETGQIGRYQLVEATVQIIGRVSVSESKELFKLDSATGKTWRYTSHAFTNRSGLSGEYWTEVPNASELRVLNWLTETNK